MHALSYISIMFKYYSISEYTCFNSQLVVHSGANVNFVGNTAHVFGGGIMVNSPVVNYTTDFLNRFCFIRYSNPDVPPQNWEVSFYSFIELSDPEFIYYVCAWGASTIVLHAFTHDLQITVV